MPTRLRSSTTSTFGPRMSATVEQDLALDARAVDHVVHAVEAPQKRRSCRSPTGRSAPSRNAAESTATRPTAPASRRNRNSSAQPSIFGVRRARSSAVRIGRSLAKDGGRTGIVGRMIVVSCIIWHSFHRRTDNPVRLSATDRIVRPTFLLRRHRPGGARQPPTTGHAFHSDNARKPPWHSAGSTPITAQ